MLGSVGCGASPEVKDFLEKVGPPKNHVAEVEALRKPAYETTFKALEINHTEPWARLIALREPSQKAGAESARQFDYLTSHLPPPDARGFAMAYVEYLKGEKAYFDSMHIVDALIDTIPRGGAPPSVSDLQQDDAALAKLAAQTAEDFPKIQATYERTR